MSTELASYLAIGMVWAQLINAVVYKCQEEYRAAAKNKSLPITPLVVFKQNDWSGYQRHSGIIFVWPFPGAF